MKVFIGADHGGFNLKEDIRGKLEGERHEVIDLGNSTMDEQDDYVDFAQRVARKVAAEPVARGILFCRNGMGMCIVANRYREVRCGIGFNTEATRKGRSDDDINVLSIPADYVTREQALEMVRAFLSEEFSEEEKYLRRIKKLELI